MHIERETNCLFLIGMYNRYRMRQKRPCPLPPETNMLRLLLVLLKC